MISWFGDTETLDSLREEGEGGREEKIGECLMMNGQAFT